MTTFDDDTALSRKGDGIYEGSVSPRWWVVRGPHGGYLCAMLLAAMSRELDDPGRAPRSFSTHFVAPPAQGPVAISVTVERVGKRMTFLSARMEQAGKLVALSLGAFSGAWEGFSFDDAPMPEVPPAEQGFKVPVTGDRVPPFLANFDMRWCIGEPPLSGAPAAVVGGWFRLDEPRIADAPVVAALLDAWAPAIFPRATEQVIAPTIDLTMHFRVPLPLEDARAEDFYLGRFSSSLGREGFFEEDGALWSPDGRLIAQSRQLALALYL